MITNDFTILFVGDDEAGKSSLIEYFSMGEFSEDYAKTETPVSVIERTIIHHTPIQFSLLDMPQKEFPKYTGQPDRVILIFNPVVTTINALSAWINKIKGKSNAPTYLVATHLDQTDSWITKKEEWEQNFKKSSNDNLFFVSSSTGVGVKELNKHLFLEVYFKLAERSLRAKLLDYLYQQIERLPESDKKNKFAAIYREVNAADFDSTQLNAKIEETRVEAIKHRPAGFLITWLYNSWNSPNTEHDFKESFPNHLVPESEENKTPQ